MPPPRCCVNGTDASPCVGRWRDCFARLMKGGCWKLSLGYLGHWYALEASTGIVRCQWTGQTKRLGGGCLDRRPFSALRTIGKLENFGPPCWDRHDKQRWDTLHQNTNWSAANQHKEKKCTVHWTGIKPVDYCSHRFICQGICEHTWLFRPNIRNQINYCKQARSDKCHRNTSICYLNDL